ncbi:MarR family winged helix-turn-helix transcriptional regulator [Kurthia sibirica]|uniref:MarR family transcriptional regulator n=1 Tax=Kurthia sibirica TaxID=202750 RepID=A0A2U3APJ3_9BACL|nr:MarR family transcriptional regulator [Kurthia sibirica]PWI26468.1 MarR family transcriptional regulator [Kurthia sibirica]GEK33036.1 putative HTH-type transcriptional regulator YwoH [Kurthia sibirica]
MNLFFHNLLQKTREFTTGANHVLKKHDLFSAQWSVLFTIEKHGVMTLTEIWKYLNVEAPTTTRTVNRLVDRGLLQHEPGEDRRLKRVSLTQAGKDKYDEVKKEIEQYENNFAKGLTKEEVAQFELLLQKLKG